MKRPVLAVTPGDPEGIGPEIVWKTLRAGKPGFRQARLLCVGSRKPFDRLRAAVREVSLEDALRGELPPEMRSRPEVLLVPAPTRAPAGAHLEGFQSGWSIETATRLVLSGCASALVTGPISKERFQAGGYRHEGHTEFLAELCGAKSVTMMLANEILRITLVTTHLALSEVPAALNRQRLRTTVMHTVEHLRKWWGIRKPRVAVAALNPHGGEAGLFGNEEFEIIAPELAALSRKLGSSSVIEGPLPADTLFAKHVMAPRRDRFDAVVCMYHDQGLIPVKLLDFPKTVNVTLGLPIVRTSVDHGVGFDIAWKNKADPSSFQSAAALALRLTAKKR